MRVPWLGEGPVIWSPVGPCWALKPGLRGQGGTLGHEGLPPNPVTTADLSPAPSSALRLPAAILNFPRALHLPWRKERPPCLAASASGRLPLAQVQEACFWSLLK